MTDYIKREDAKKVCESTIGIDEVCFFSYLKGRIQNIPAADVVEVVRCKDCKHFEPDAKADDSYYDGICRSPKTGLGWRQKKDDFCSAGERKDNMTDWEAVDKFTMLAADRFLTEYCIMPTTVIGPAGIIDLIKKEHTKYKIYPDEEPVRFYGMIVRESPRIKSIESLEVY